jgi:probable rRNA maturation factor
MVLNRQSRVRVTPGDLEKFLGRACRSLRLPRQSFTVCLVTNAEIARWNRIYRGKPGPTDVLSFTADEKTTRSSKRSSFSPHRVRFSSSTASPYLGDIAIAPAVAMRNARRFGRTLKDEMRILILHGILHLMGYDHETDNGQMERREARLRRALGLA